MDKNTTNNDGGAYNTGSGTSAYNTANSATSTAPTGRGQGQYQNRGATYWAPPNRKPRTWLTAIIVLVICATVVLLFFGCLNTINPLKQQNDTEQNAFAPPAVKYLAKIYVVGQIADTDDVYSSSSQTFHYRYTLSTIDSLMADTNNAGLILFINSPGGTVYESDATYLKIMEYKEKTKRPVFAYMGSMAASGGYYIAAAADYIYANRNTWTGSIGVISGTFFDVSEFLTNHGIKATDIVSGKNKAMGSYFHPMTKEQKDILQSLVDEAYEQFVGVVADSRDKSIDEIKKLADGRIYTAEQARVVGLIDYVMGEQQAYDSIKKSIGDEKMKIAEMNYKAQQRLLNILGDARSSDMSASGKTGSSASKFDSDVARVLDMVENSNPFELKYLYQ